MSNFSFLNPIYFWALPTLFIPIIIHLLFRQKVKRVLFSSTIFFKKSSVQKSKVKKLSKILQLFLRLLIFLLIGIVFSTPFNKKHDFSQLGIKNSQVFCWIDPSVTMEYRDNETTAFEKAQSLISFLDSTLNSPEVYIYNRASGDFVEKERSDFTELKNIGPLFGKSNFLEMVSAFDRELNRRTLTEKSTLLLFTDLNKETSKLIKGYLDKLEQMQISVVIIDLAPKKVFNRSVFINSDTSSNDIKIKIKYSSEISSSPVSLISEGIRRWHKSFISAEISDTAIYIPEQKKITIFRVLFDKGDNFIFDDTLFFAKRKQRNNKILFVENSNGFSPFYEAISTVLNSDVIIQRVNDKDVNFDDIEKSDLIILNSINSSSRAVNALFTQSAYSNKAILFSPSLFKPNLRFQSDLLNSLEQSKSDSIIFRDATVPTIRLSRNSIWKDFAVKKTSAIKIYSQLYSVPGKRIITLSDQTPFLTTITDSNNNRWVISSTPLDMCEFNNFAQTGFYLPILGSMLELLVKGGSSDVESLYAGIPFNNPLFGLSQRVTIANAKERFSIVSREKIEINHPGIYQLISGDSVENMAINIDPAELVLEYDNFNISKNHNLKKVNNSQFKVFISTIKKGYIITVLLLVIMMLILFDQLIDKRYR